MEITHYPDIPNGLTYQWGTQYDFKKTNKQTKKKGLNKTQNNSWT